MDCEGYFSFPVPPSLKQQFVIGIDSYVAHDRDRDLLLDIDYGGYSNDLALR